MLSERQRERFFVKVSIINDTDSCWEWTASKSPDGYGRTVYDGISTGAHRVAYIIEHGLSEPPELCVLHRCDNPGCVRPSHLFLGTRQDNMYDRYQKGRYPTPTKKPLKNGINLSREEIEQIRTMRRHGEGYVYLSRKFKVSLFTICKIEQGRI